MPGVLFTLTSTSFQAYIYCFMFCLIASFLRDFGSQGSEGAEEKMAAAVLTSLSLSPVLKNMQVEHGTLLQ